MGIFSPSAPRYEEPKSEVVFALKDEEAFYDALAANEYAVKAMGSAELLVIAAELVTQVRKSVTIDWTVRHPTVATCNEILKSFEHTRSIESRLCFFVGPRASLRGRSPIELALSRKRADWTRAKLLARAALE